MTVKKDTAYFLGLGVADAQASRARGDSSERFAFRYDRNATNWQARAYWMGFDGEVTRMSRRAISEAPPTTPPTTAQKTPPDANPEAETGSPTQRSLPRSFEEAITQPWPFPSPKVDGVELETGVVIDLSGWPEAPRAHYLALANDLESEEDEARRNRLSAAMNRVVERWGTPR